jgi:hypothetical protein
VALLSETTRVDAWDLPFPPSSQSLTDGDRIMQPTDGEEDELNSNAKGPISLSDEEDVWADDKEIQLRQSLKAELYPSPGLWDVTLVGDT